ncbi:MAG TPA: tRNA pseudouridine(38-40) synthase TruA [Bacteroidales bacterium]|nr:tRNA pseudouridine(38-40) synthase TruA [Bacteroidales bacterium]
MTTRYFLLLSYKGTSYYGWQIQPGSITVQKTITDALNTILQEKIEVTGAGRTDTGVHASYYVAHFESNINDLETKKNIILRLNKYLPRDIAVDRIVRVKPDAHARFNAISRTYKYYINRKKDPFTESLSWFIFGDINVDMMNEMCIALLEYSDFTSFARLHSDAKTNICKIYSASWTEQGSKLIFTIKADRFLRNMVRSIVGTMIEAGRGKLTIDEFREIILAKDRCRAGKSAPAKGLFLEDIEYPPEIFEM